jgi:hypothetical protein
MSRRSRLVAALLAAVGCAKRGDRVTDGAVYASPEGLVWALQCPGGDPALAWLWFAPDGGLHTAYPDADDWRRDAGDRWTLDPSGRSVHLAWADGYATAALRWNGSASVRGTSSRRACPSAIRLDAAPDVAAPPAPR